MFSVRNQYRVRPLIFLQAFKDVGAVDGSEAILLDTLEYRTRFFCSLYISIAEICPLPGILLLYRCFVPLQLVVVDGCAALVFNNQERIVVNLGPNVDILPLASDIDADYLKIRILPGKKSNEALSYTMQLRGLPRRTLGQTSLSTRRTWRLEIALM